MHQDDSGTTSTSPGGFATTWDELPTEVVRPGVRRCAVGTGDVMLVMNTIDPVMVPAPHRHSFTQIACIVSGRARYTVGDHVYEVGPGSVLVIPPDVDHHIESLGEEPVLNLDVFAPPRADYSHLVEWMEAGSGGPKP